MGDTRGNRYNRCSVAVLAVLVAAALLARNPFELALYVMAGGAGGAGRKRRCGRYAA